MKRLVILTALVCSALVGTAQQDKWQIQTPHLFNPRSDDTDAGGTRFWHDNLNQNWLAYRWADAKGEKIVITIIDHDRPGHVDTMTTLSLHLENRASSSWIADTIIVQKYGKQPNGKFWPAYKGPFDEPQFNRITKKIIDRLDIWRKQ